MQITRPLVENRQHFPCRIVISQHGRGGGAGEVGGSDGRALDGEGVSRDCATNRRERRNRNAVGDGCRHRARDGERVSSVGVCIFYRPRIIII